MIVPALTIAAGVVAYLLAPGPAQSILGSWPLTAAGVVALIAAVGTLVLTWGTGGQRRLSTSWALALGALVVLRIVSGVAETPRGWLGSYYSNATWEGQPEWSSDFRLENATRIDRQLSFAGTEFPTYYLNDPRYTEGVFREVTEPMTVEWSGAFDAPEAMLVEFDVRANGSASIAFDGESPSFTGAAGKGRHQVSAGRHAVIVRYLKPANTDGQLDVSLTAMGDSIVVVPASSPADSPWPRFLAAALDLIAIGLLSLAAFASLREVLASSQRAGALVALALLATLGLQGFLAARPMLGRFVSLSGGDDWLGFESRARDVLQHGVMMTLGQPLGEGAAYFYHPFYSYVLAMAHAIGGESLFAPIFMHFLVLAATAVLMWSFAREIFGELPAACGLAALLLVFEIDFIRYYTITLLSENIYILTVTLCLRSFARWAREASTGALISAGAWAGVSAVTRPAMMMFFVPALLVAFVIAARPPSPRLRRAGRKAFAGGLAAAAMIAGSWLAVVAPFTIRNWIVSHKLVLISDSLGDGFIAHNMPAGIDHAAYLNGYSGGIVASVGVLWRILIEHPSEFLSLQIQKFGFALGMVHWYDDYRPHPELVAVTALYLVMLAVSPAMRSAALWPVHAFVLSHVASMGMTSPWNYGYRLILPAFVYTTTFSVAAAAAWLLKRHAQPSTIGSPA